MSASRSAVGPHPHQTSQCGPPPNAKNGRRCAMAGWVAAVPFVVTEDGPGGSRIRIAESELPIRLMVSRLRSTYPLTMLLYQLRGIQAISEPFPARPGAGQSIAIHGSTHEVYGSVFTDFNCGSLWQVYMHRLSFTTSENSGTNGIKISLQFGEKARQRRQARPIFMLCQLRPFQSRLQSQISDRVDRSLRKSLADNTSRDLRQGFVLALRCSR